MATVDFTRIVFVLTLIEISHCFNILLMPFNVGSHVLLMTNIGRQLVEDDNDVHVLLMENPESEEVFRNTGVKIIKYKTRRLTGEDNKAWIDQMIDEFITLSMKGTYGSIKAVEALMHTMEEEGKIMLEYKYLLEKNQKLIMTLLLLMGFLLICITILYYINMIYRLLQCQLLQILSQQGYLA